MALKHLMEMTKADRYTADGCEALNKAREADVEDRTYKTGEISEKTGLQKQPDGSWAPPKHGAHPKMGSKEYNEKYGLSEKDVKTGAEVDKIYERQLKRIKELKAKGFTDEQIDNDKIIKQTKEDMRNVGKKAESKPSADWAEQRDQIGGEIKGNLEAAKYYFDKAQSFSTTDPSYKTYMLKAKEYNDMAKNQADDYGFYFEEMHNSGITTAVNNYAKEQSKPAESKPAAQEVKLGERADKYIIPNLDRMSDEDKVFKALNTELAETFGDRDGFPGDVGTWANRWLDHAMDEGGIGFKKSHRSEEPDAVVSGDDVMKIVEENPARWNRIIGNAKKFYEGKGSSTDFESDESYPSKDSAPRQLTGDCKIRVRK